MTTHPSMAPVRPGGDEPSGRVRDHVCELVERLAARGLHASAAPDAANPAGAMVVTAQRVNIHPNAGRTVFLQPAQGRDGLYWHWQRRFSSHPRIGARWFQPFCRGDDVVTAAEAIAAAIDADVRARARLMHAPFIGPDAGEEPDREVLAYVGYRVHSLAAPALAGLLLAGAPNAAPGWLRRWRRGKPVHSDRPLKVKGPAL